MSGSAPAPVAIVMGSQSDWATMQGAADVLDKLGVATDVRIVSAHRTPERLFAFASGAAEAGFKVVIAGAGGAAHLPGMMAAYTELPVIGVPVVQGALEGQDALLSIVQMPRGIPVATVAIGGAANAGILAVQILSAQESQRGTELRRRVREFKDGLEKTVLEKAATFSKTR